MPANPDAPVRRRAAAPRCPHCGEPVEVDFDPLDAGAGEHRFVQDCDVCCHPLSVVVHAEASGAVRIAVDRS